MSFSEELQLVNSRKAAELLGLTMHGLYALTAPRGPLPAVRMRKHTGRLYYRISDLRRFIEERLTTWHIDTRATKKKDGHDAGSTKGG